MSESINKPKITAAMIKELRERTCAGFLECQQALKAADGDMEKAIDAMRKSGQAKAAKKTTRIAREGVIVVKTSSDAKKAVMIEVNCETDFVARDENFKNFAQMLVERGLSNDADTVEKLLGLTVAEKSDQIIEKAREELIAKVGENIQVRRLMFTVSQNTIYSYLHSGRIGVLVDLSVADEKLGKDIAMHIAASRPEFVSSQDVSQALIAREKEIYLAQSIASGKPQAIAEKMVAGRIDKFINEVTLLGQPFIKDTNITVADLLKQKSAQVIAFQRYEVGDGIEKKAVDFAAEVESQLHR
jgi:elongation factor Ts